MVNEWSNWKRSLWLVLSHTSVSMDTNVWSFLCGLQLILLKVWPTSYSHTCKRGNSIFCFWYHILKEERWQALIGLRPGHLFASPVSVCLPASASCLLGLLRIYEKELHLINRLDGCLIKWQFNFYELVSCKGVLYSSQWNRQTGTKSEGFSLEFLGQIENIFS